MSVPTYDEYDAEKGWSVFRFDKHPSFFDQPPPESHVWRYMDLARFLSMLEDSALHFVRADRMADAWEGSYSEVNVAQRPLIYGEHYEALESQREEIRKLQRASMYLNCWHVAEQESAAMWEIYQREGRGVAIRSTWGRLVSSVRDSKPIRGANVRYIDYSKVFVPEGDLFAPLLFKRESFSHEREARLIHWSLEDGYDGEETIGPSALDGQNVLPVSVDLDALVEDVFVAPDAPEWIEELVRKVVISYGRRFRVTQSDLRRDPIA